MKKMYILLALIGLLATGVWIVGAQDAGDIPGVAISISADGISAPETVTAGLTTVTFTNDNAADAFLILTRINEGVALDEAVAAFTSEAGPQEALGLVSLLGGPVVGAQSSGEATYDLSVGTYAVVDPEAVQIATFEVVEGAGGAELAPPQADQTITLVDFNFQMPLALEAGEQIWQIQNAGEQWHEMFIFRVPDDTPVGMLMRGLLADEEEEAPDTGDESGFFWTPMFPGETAWVTLDLEPGTYIVGCGLPDIVGGGPPHIHQGMMKIVTVGG